jgi:hypothetical protein
MLAAAIASLVVGVLLSHLIEPGLRVERLILAGYTPAIHLFPKTSGPHPLALLAHGVTASKETLCSGLAKHWLRRDLIATPWICRDTGSHDCASLEPKS